MAVASVYALEAGGMDWPILVSEIGMGRPGRQHQGIVWYLLVVHNYDAPFGIDVRHRAKHYVCIRLAPQNRPNRPRDIRRR